ncbi:hypothetical protein LAN30_25975, partial [Mycobacterium tuberculosis]|nr:hypothetical protein [Mycobacterium tuberculosis]
VDLGALRGTLHGADPVECHGPAGHPAALAPPGVAGGGVVPSGGVTGVPGVVSSVVPSPGPFSVGSSGSPSGSSASNHGSCTPT